MGFFSAFWSRFKNWSFNEWNQAIQEWPVHLICLFLCGQAVPRSQKHGKVVKLCFSLCTPSPSANGFPLLSSLCCSFFPLCQLQSAAVGYQSCSQCNMFNPKWKSLCELRPQCHVVNILDTERGQGGFWLPVVNTIYCGLLIAIYRCLCISY